MPPLKGPIRRLAFEQYCLLHLVTEAEFEFLFLLTKFELVLKLTIVSFMKLVF